MMSPVNSAFFAVCVYVMMSATCVMVIFMTIALICGAIGLLRDSIRGEF